MRDYVVITRKVVYRKSYQHVQCNTPDEARKLALESESEDCSQEDVVESEVVKIVDRTSMDTSGIECSQLAESEMSREVVFAQ